MYFLHHFRCSCAENQRRKTEYINDGGEEMTSMCVPSGNWMSVFQAEIDSQFYLMSYKYYTMYKAM